MRSLRRQVGFETYDITLQQIITMVRRGQLDVDPFYQRRFRWDEERSSELVESLILGIPVPNIFCTSNTDATWELVDGVQRLSAVIAFAGDKEAREVANIARPLKLLGLDKLTTFNGATFEGLPSTLQLHFETRPLKVVVLNDRSDPDVRFDLFERLNRGGVELSEQEIRHVVYRGEFTNFLQELAADENFHRVLRLQKSKELDASREEAVLRFFAYYDSYETFDHSVKDFLTGYTKLAAKSFPFRQREDVFRKTFAQLAEVFPNGIQRPGRSARKTTPINLYEGVVVGAALAIDEAGELRSKSPPDWISSEKLKEFTSGATNSLPAVRGRIEFCRDRFLES